VRDGDVGTGALVEDVVILVGVNKMIRRRLFGSGGGV
jgi:hypothetical protein